MRDLLPCPFCGGEAEVFITNGINDPNMCYMVECNNCLAKSPFCKTKQEAIKAWNTRAKPVMEYVKGCIAERTCKPVYPNDSDYREVEIARCSNCKRPIMYYELSDKLANYCHYCGCRVVSE